MISNSFGQQPPGSDVGVYECEIYLKFRLIEERCLPRDREQLLELLLEAFACSEDEGIERIKAKVRAQAVDDEIKLSPKLRRQLLRLRNSSQLA